MEQIDDKKFVDIPDYVGLYAINRIGEVKSTPIIGKYYPKSKPTNYIKKYQLGKRGYPVIRLYKDGIGKNFYIHRLLAICFIPNLENRPNINHIDGDRTNFNISNLEWVNDSENLLHRYRILGKVSKERKFSKDEIFDILSFDGNKATTVLSKKYNVHFNTIYDIRVGKRYLEWFNEYCQNSDVGDFKLKVKSEFISGVDRLELMNKYKLGRGRINEILRSK